MNVSYVFDYRTLERSLTQRLHDRELAVETEKEQVDLISVIIISTVISVLVLVLTAHALD